MNKASASYRTTPNSLIYVWLVSQDRMGWRYIFEEIVNIIQIWKTKQNYKSADPRSSMNPKQKKYKENYTKAYDNQVCFTPFMPEGQLE